MLLPFSELNSLNLMVIASMLTSIVVSVETYGRLRRGYPLVGKCDDDIIDSHQKRYVRWMWGFDQKNWTGNLLKRRKNNNSEVEEKIDDNEIERSKGRREHIINDIVEEEINTGITKEDNKYEYKDQSCHLPCAN
jgi:hypothetical protein